ncbi:hypothetical protein FH972_008984 [Carpinus fangiana]|uniref:Ribosomal protein L34Ae n=1 Tax=Carpinus fangiana TaxID=176857 RepID=A0A5N6R375_9ROSI|nr:hypothetical protein FH972_008984 [Carpinus fangiana]
MNFCTENMTSVMGSVWVLFCNYVFYVFGLMIRFIFRSRANDSKNDYGCCVIPFQQDDQTGSRDSDIDGFREEGAEVGFSLQKSKSGNKSFGERETFRSVTAANVSKYEFSPGKGIFAGKDCEKLNSEEEAVGQLKTEDSVESFGIGKALEKAEENTFVEDGISEKGEIVGAEANFLGKDGSVDEAESVSEDCSLRFCSEPETICSVGELSDSDHIIDSITHEFLADKKVDEELKSEALLANDGEEVQYIQEIPSCENVEELSDSESLLGPEETVARDQSDDSDEEYIELEPHFQNSSSWEAKALSGKVENKHEAEDLVQEESEPEVSSEESEGTDLRKEPSEDYQDDLDFLLEHRDVIEQLKMELRNVRAGGLPTILEEEEEEPESPAMVQGLKPLKIDEKFEFKDRMEEVQKVYKGYAEKMRKLDMLNSQTMHAIGFLQLKDPVKSISKQKPSASATMSLPHNIWSRKARRVMADPMQKFIGELQRDLELVYVGQVCLSWEILHWQYVKAQKLQEYDSQGFHWYNQVAGEFQLFQVLVQRFVENEAFQGPRVQNYVNNRCVLRNLLQVPAIRDDCLKDKKVRRGEEEDAISSCMIAKVIEESMRVFWGFIRADKDEGNHVILNGPWQNPTNLQNDADLGFLMEIRADLQKKEKKLKDILRSGNCIVKRFQRPDNDQVLLDHLLLFAQVELKLVSRVLNMSRLTTDQLVWCREKLDQINFIHRKIHVEPSFLLFPC